MKREFRNSQQRRIDEENYEWFPHNFEPVQVDSVNLDPEPDPDIDLMKRLTSTAYGIVTESLGGKAEKVDVSLSKWTESWIVSDSNGTKVDVLIPRARITILVKTKDGSEAHGSIGGSCGTLQEILARYVPKAEDCSSDALAKNPDLVSKDPFVIVSLLAKRVVKETIDLDRAQNAAIVGNECFVILSSQAAGVFVHEVFGHPSEGDIICENRRSKTAKVQLKSMIGSQLSDNTRFTAVDTPEPVLELPGERKICFNWGSLPHYDEYGVRTKSAVLIQNGIRVGALLDYRTFEEVVSGLKDEIANGLRQLGHSGNSRSEKYDEPPILRMRNTFIMPDENGPKSKAEMAKLIPVNQKGIYMKSINGGWVNTEDGTFMLIGNLCYLIENGIITDKPVKNVKVTGNIAKFQSNIRSIGAPNLMRYTFTGWCGKDDQWVPVDGGGPPILLEKVSLAGGSAWHWTKVVEEFDRQHREVIEGKRSPRHIYLNEFSEVLSPEVSHQNICLSTAFLSPQREAEIIRGLRRDKATHEMTDEGKALDRGDMYDKA